MRVMISANGPHVASGYGRPARELGLALQRMGHEVAIYAWFGVMGGAIKAANMVLFPRIGAPLYGQDAEVWAAHWGADLVVTIEDIWVLPATFARKLNRPWVAWFPVDGVPAPPAVVERARTATVPAVYSLFGVDELRAAGVEHARYVPLGVDCSVYRPLDRAETRARHLVPDGAFVVTMVAANKGWPCRKSFPEAIEAFGRFHRRRPEAVLYLHTDAKGEGVGIDLERLITQLGLPAGSVKFPDQVEYLLGMSDEHMAEIYNVSDALLSPSMGEGFGLPIIEAQACGCPVITQAVTSMTELTVNGLAIPPLQRFYEPIGHWKYLASVDEIEGALESIYRRPAREREQAAAAGIRFVRDEFHWPSLIERYWRPLVDEIEAMLAQPGKNGAPDRKVHDVAEALV